jgi:hypothetical protein
MNQLNTTHLQNFNSPADSQCWGDLKQAVSDTSGFKRWVLERNIDHKEAEPTQEVMVQLYLRQTLETLAY